MLTQIALVLVLLVAALAVFPADEADRRAEAGAKLSYRGPGMEATDPLGEFGLPEDAPRDPQQPPVELAHPGLAARPNLVTRVLAQPKLWLIGDERALAA